jgi:hypothetical protein
VVVAVWESKALSDWYGAEQLFLAFQEFGLAPDMIDMRLSQIAADQASTRYRHPDRGLR